MNTFNKFLVIINTLFTFALVFTFYSATSGETDELQQACDNQLTESIVEVTDLETVELEYNAALPLASHFTEEVGTEEIFAKHEKKLREPKQPDINEQSAASDEEDISQRWNELNNSEELVTLLAIANEEDGAFAHSQFIGKALALAQELSIEQQVYALDVLENAITEQDLMHLEYFLYSDSAPLQEEAFLRVAEIPVSDTTLAYLEYLANYSASPWVQGESRTIIDQHTRQPVIDDTHAM